jgi:hypothetical protein
MAVGRSSNRPDGKCNSGILALGIRTHNRSARSSRQRSFLWLEPHLREDPERYSMQLRQIVIVTQIYSTLSLTLLSLLSTYQDTWELSHSTLRKVNRTVAGPRVEQSLLHIRTKRICCT